MQHMHREDYAFDVRYCKILLTWFSVSGVNPAIAARKTARDTMQIRNIRHLTVLCIIYQLDALIIIYEYS